MSKAIEGLQGPEQLEDRSEALEKTAEHVFGARLQEVREYTQNRDARSGEPKHDLNLYEESLVPRGASFGFSFKPEGGMVKSEEWRQADAEVKKKLEEEGINPQREWGAGSLSLAERGFGLYPKLSQQLREEGVELEEFVPLLNNVMEELYRRKEGGRRRFSDEFYRFNPLEEDVRRFMAQHHVVVGQKGTLVGSNEAFYGTRILEALKRYFRQ